MIAPKYLVAPLAILGIDTFAAETPAEARAALEKAKGKKEPSLIFISERLADGLQVAITKINQKPNMNVVLIPDNRGSTGLAASQIQNLVRNSIGAEVIIRK